MKRRNYDPCVTAGAVEKATVDRDGTATRTDEKTTGDVTGAPFSVPLVRRRNTHLVAAVRGFALENINEHEFAPRIRRFSRRCWSPTELRLAVKDFYLSVDPVRIIPSDTPGASDPWYAWSRQEEFFLTLAQRYGIDTVEDFFGDVEGKGRFAKLIRQERDLKQKLELFYAKFSPEKRNGVDILVRFYGPFGTFHEYDDHQREHRHPLEELTRKLVERYPEAGPNPLGLTAAERSTKATT